MKLTLKTLNPDEGGVRYEVHKSGCSDSKRGVPINEIKERIFECEVGSPEELIGQDIGNEYDYESHRKTYRIAPCCLKSK